jgi:D-galactarolactone cycloisomerase
VKVDRVEAFPIKIRAKENLQGGSFGYTHYQTVLTEVYVDGVEGWGEAMTRADPEATALLVKHFGGAFVGREFEDPTDPWEEAWKGLRVRGHTRGVDVEALSGIEMAIFDAYGRIKKQPLNRLFSRSPSTHVTAFAGSLFSSRGPLEGQVEFAKGKGLLGAKVKVGFGVNEDAQTLKRVRRLWPEGMLVADANGAYDARTAKKACSAFSGLDLAWFEEPVLSDDFDGYSHLKESGVKIGAGESWFPGDFERPIRDGLVGVVEPSVSRCGGVHVEVTVAKMARARGIGFSPMTGMNSVVSLAASIHAASAVGSVGAEYNPFPNPIQTELATGIEEPREGRIRVPTGPGLGIEIDRRFVRSNAAR